MPIDLVVFDLDGTLIDSALDLALSVNASRAHAGMGHLDHSLIYSYVGDGAPMLMRRALGEEAPQSQVDDCLAFFIDYYRDHMLDNTVLYPGVQEGLDAMKANGKTMAVLTNKPVNFSRTIVERIGLGDHFIQVYGGNSFDSKKPDPYGINLLMHEASAKPESTMMVGDSSVDVLTARNAGTPCCGVSYGLRPESFEKYPPAFVVDSLVELAKQTNSPA